MAPGVLSRQVGQWLVYLPPDSPGFFPFDNPGYSILTNRFRQDSFPTRYKRLFKALLYSENKIPLLDRTGGFISSLINPTPFSAEADGTSWAGVLTLQQAGLCRNFTGLAIHLSL